MNCTHFLYRICNLLMDLISLSGAILKISVRFWCFSVRISKVPNICYYWHILPNIYQLAHKWNKPNLVKEIQLQKYSFFNFWKNWRKTLFWRVSHLFWTNTLYFNDFPSKKILFNVELFHLWVHFQKVWVSIIWSQNLHQNIAKGTHFQ